MQRYLADTYLLPQAEFMHVLGSTRGRENIYHVRWDLQGAKGVPQPTACRETTPGCTRPTL